MTIPNQLTLLRIVFSFFLIFFLLIPGLGAKLAALVVFIAACLTDFFDGRLAKRWGVITDFGMLMDPIADKILVLSAFVSFVQLQLIPGWMVVVIAGREFLVTGFRLFAMGKGKVLAAERAGKLKTASQMTAISVILLFLVVDEMMGDSYSRTAAGSTWLWWLTFVAVVLTLTSGISFLWNNRRLILNL
ncbi:MAG: CDP-diacylglycerol--glycerol-3-phosphate 3-phosphatidyltransferase [Candidatus Omnitrophica bacterium]|nr:CDP-diacylglycerol--glycerol-3-phosphate 3-phosphatidyltransferase [Candidatus Omnitrophota bacterium]